MTRRLPPGPDLFQAAAMAEAAERARAAEEARAAAERRARYAPRGEILARQRVLQDATTAALAEEVRLAQAQAEGQA